MAGAEGLNPAFAGGLASLFAAAKAAGHTVQVFSGYRSVAKQKQLWDQAVRKYGSAAGASRWVAPPGKSNHNHGVAADLRFSSAAAREWVHENARRYGLYFPMGHEPWHIEPIGGRRGQKEGHTTHSQGKAKADPTDPAALPEPEAPAPEKDLVYQMWQLQKLISDPSTWEQSQPLGDAVEEVPA